ncbi:MAG: LacI family DNA-binding transcriptional regulator, partial [Spirochaetota bacterium]
PQRETRAAPQLRRVGILTSLDPEWTFAWHFLAEMIVTIERELRTRQMQTLLIPISHHEDAASIFQKVTGADCGAVYSIHIGSDELFDQLEDAGIPVILIMNNSFQDRFFSICVDDFHGAYEGTQHLLNLGHRRILFADGKTEDLPVLSTDRYYGFLKAIEETDGSAAHTRMLCRGGVTEQELEEELAAALDGSEPFTAVFSLDDEVALAVWTALAAIGYRVPEDISILAPGDVLDYSKSYVPRISTMHIDMADMGQLAVDMLNNRLSENAKTIHVLKVHQQLIDRGSCRRI